MNIREFENLLKSLKDNPTTHHIYRERETKLPTLDLINLDLNETEKAIYDIVSVSPILTDLAPEYDFVKDVYEIRNPFVANYAAYLDLPEMHLRLILSYHPNCVQQLLNQINSTYGKGLPNGPAKRAKREEVTDWLQYYEVLGKTEAEQMNYSKKWTAEQFAIAKEWFHPYQIASHFENQSRLLKTQPFQQEIMPLYKATLADRMCKLPLVSETYLKNLLLIENPPKDLKEMYVHPYGTTDQFDDSKEWQSCFPTHNPRDYATLMWSIKKRLRFVKERQNELNYGRPITLMLGLSLFNKFVDYYEIPEQNFCDILWGQCIDENYRNRLNKSFTTLLNKLDVCDPDFDIHEAGLFMKSQGLTKIGRLYKEAKAGQMIIELKEIVILIMGVAVRYVGTLMENFFAAKKTLINYRMTPTRMFKFVKENWNFDRLSTSNDFTLFDTNQGVEFVRFQVALMKHLDIPNFIIDFYEDYKLNIVTKYGYLAVMTLSGEPPTFLFNSFDNIAYSLLKYNIKPNTPMLIGGDDGTFNAELSEREDFVKTGKYFTLTAVSEYGFSPTFCGWHFTADGPYKDPLLLVHRLYRAIEMHNLDNVIDSYSDEAKYAYVMGQAVYDHMDEKELTCQSFLNRFFVINKDKLHTASAYRMSDNDIKSLNQHA